MEKTLNKLKSLPDLDDIPEGFEFCPIDTTVVGGNRRWYGWGYFLPVIFTKILVTEKNYRLHIRLKATNQFMTPQEAFENWLDQNVAPHNFILWATGKTAQQAFNECLQWRFLYWWLDATSIYYEGFSELNKHDLFIKKLDIGVMLVQAAIHKTNDKIIKHTLYVATKHLNKECSYKQLQQARNTLKTHQYYEDDDVTLKDALLCICNGNIWHAANTLQKGELLDQSDLTEMFKFHVKYHELNMPNFSDLEPKPELQIEPQYLQHGDGPKLKIGVEYCLKGWNKHKFFIPRSLDFYDSEPMIYGKTETRTISLELYKQDWLEWQPEPEAQR